MKKLIVIDGGEGVGKTSVLARLRAEYPRACFTREPGGTPFAEALRAVILGSEGKESDRGAQHMLFWAARADHVAKLIVPMLVKGEVFVDRFDSSTYAYQIQSRLSSLHELFWQVRKVALRDVVPHYIILDTDEAISYARVTARASMTQQAMTHFDASSLEEHRRRRAGFRQFTRCLDEGWGKGTYAFVDATPDREIVAEAVLAEVRQCLA